MRVTPAVLRGLVREAVIDAAERFRQKRAADAVTKATDLAIDTPGVFEKQESQEEYVDALLEDLKELPNSIVSLKGMRLACPWAFDEDEGWGPEATAFDVVSHASKYNADDWENLRAFVSLNRDAFTRAAATVKARLDEIAREADEMEWAAPWRRYTAWGSVAASVTRFVANVNEMMRVNEIIRRCGGSWCLYTRNKGKGGKRRRLGTHPSKKAAQRQERAIKANGG